MLLQKSTKERDEALKEKRAAKRVAKQRRIDEDGGHSQQEKIDLMLEMLQLKMKIV